MNARTTTALLLMAGAAASGVYYQHQAGAPSAIIDPSPQVGLRYIGNGDFQIIYPPTINPGNYQWIVEWATNVNGPWIIDSGESWIGDTRWIDTGFPPPANCFFKIHGITNGTGPSVALNP